MDFQHSEEQEELRQMARGFLADRSGPEQVREAMQSPIGYDTETWRQITAELGWSSVHIPEAYGGLGLGHVDLAVLLEATGETLLCAPFFSTVALATNTILEICADGHARIRRGLGPVGCARNRDYGSTRR